MSRTARYLQTKIIIAVLLVAGIGGVWYYQAHHTSKSKLQVQTQIVTSQTPTTDLTYQGQDGKNALELLKTHAQVQTKSSSLGDYVTSINGNDGGGTKYWIFYVNGKESQVGAGAYVTHTGDHIEWKLQ